VLRLDAPASSRSTAPASSMRVRTVSLKPILYEMLSIS
jgi:hypothetical protein